MVRGGGRGRLRLVVGVGEQSQGQSGEEGEVRPRGLGGKGKGAGPSLAGAASVSLSPLGPASPGWTDGREVQEPELSRRPALWSLSHCFKTSLAQPLPIGFLYSVRPLLFPFFVRFLAFLFQHLHCSSCQMHLLL